MRFVRTPPTARDPPMDTGHTSHGETDQHTQKQLHLAWGGNLLVERVGESFRGRAGERGWEKQKERSAKNNDN